MQFSTILLALAGTTIASAIPAAAPISRLEDRQAPLCSGLSGSPVCCATDVLGVVVLNCDNRE